MNSIGIDFGNAYSVIAYEKTGVTHIIPPLEGREIFPSAVYIPPHGDMVFGLVAKNSLSACPQDGVEYFKYMLGSSKQIYLNGKIFTIEQITSLFLKYIKDSAQQYLNTFIGQAVITIPTHFSTSQREATKKACFLAGFQEIYLLEEPIAACIAYHLQTYSSDMNVLIYDLGVHAFTSSIVYISHSKFTTIATIWEDTVGGDDFEKLLFEFLISQANKLYNTDILKSSDSDSRLGIEQRFKDAAKQLKLDLSMYETAHVKIPFFSMLDGIPISFEDHISRQTFQQLIHEKLEFTFQLIEQLLKQAKLQSKDITHVLLVGGSTYIPRVKERISQYFDAVVLNTIKPDEVLAHGAALFPLFQTSHISNVCRNPFNYTETGDVSLLVDYFTLFDIHITSNDTEIKRAYSNMLRKYPPERFSKEFHLISNAYQTLINEKTRFHYIEKINNSSY